MELPLSVVGAGPGPLSESVSIAPKRRCNIGGGLLSWTEEGGVTVDGGCLKRTNTTMSGAQAEKEQIVNLACVRFEVVEKKAELFSQVQSWSQLKPRSFNWVIRSRVSLSSQNDLEKDSIEVLVPVICGRNLFILLVLLYPQGLKAHYRDGAPLEEVVVSFILEHALTGRHFTNHWIPDVVSALRISQENCITFDRVIINTRISEVVKLRSSIGRVRLGDPAVLFPTVLEDAAQSVIAGMEIVICHPQQGSNNQVIATAITIQRSAIHKILVFSKVAHSAPSQPPSSSAIIAFATLATDLDNAVIKSTVKNQNAETLYTPSIAKGTLIGKKSLPETALALNTSIPPCHGGVPVKVQLEAAPDWYYGNMTQDSDGRRAVPPERLSNRPGRQGHPYSRNSVATSSTISRTNSESQASEIPLYDDLDSVQGGSESRRRGKQPEVPKLDLTRYTTQERTAIEWMRKKVEMDMLTIKGWESLVMDEEKLAADTYYVHGCLGRLSDAFADVLLSSSKEDLYLNFLHGRKITGNKVVLVLFGSDHLRDGHIQRWYNDLRSPLCDELFRNSLTTTPFTMLGWSAVGMRFSIDRIVDPRARFSKAKYSAWHSKVVKDMERTSQHPVHGQEFVEYLLDLHLSGMEVLMKLLERNLNDGVVYIPSSPSEMSQPLDLLELKFNCRISQSSTAPPLHLTKVKSSHSSTAAPLYLELARPGSSRVVVQSPEPYSGMGPSQISQTHTFAGGHPESLSTPPFADYSQPVFSDSLYRLPGMEFSSAESSEQLRIQENYYDNLDPSESQQGTFDVSLGHTLKYFIALCKAKPNNRPTHHDRHDRELSQSFTSSLYTSQDLLIMSRLNYSHEVRSFWSEGVPLYWENEHPFYALCARGFEPGHPFFTSMDEIVPSYAVEVWQIFGEEAASPTERSPTSAVSAHACERYSNVPAPQRPHSPEIRSQPDTATSPTQRLRQLPLPPCASLGLQPHDQPPVATPRPGTSGVDGHRQLPQAPTVQPNGYNGSRPSTGSATFPTSSTSKPVVTDFHADGLQNIHKAVPAVPSHTSGASVNAASMCKATVSLSRLNHPLDLLALRPRTFQATAIYLMTS
ncbi:hypothetical protein EDD22DRAFT_850083 [Suillus occidentalis]|nr:hypothetical protein EDD22DRAFT_850083 [Suillus occidentalis]